MSDNTSYLSEVKQSGEWSNVVHSCERVGAFEVKLKVNFDRQQFERFIDLKRREKKSQNLFFVGQSKTRRKGEIDAVDSVFDPLREFAKDSVRLVKRCHKPDGKEFTKVAFRTAIGFVVMAFVGFFVKLIFIPINNIIVGSR
ncbi:uncharacterized protein LOC120121731 [Hibiscus syriacus]|uniref:uncharacterized protein LOC120121731 n=1 Tax=Hibiscus syriacus TaxID=106335 RepID=UPI001921AE3A|nr:uncharacterized protein LOC120121731 [Hibiscus syriacus]